MGTTPHDHSKAWDGKIPYGGMIDGVAISASVGAYHIQGTDQALDTGGENEITAAHAKEAYDHISLKSGVHGLHTTFRNMGRDRFLAKIFKKGYFKKEVF